MKIEPIKIDKMIVIENVAWAWAGVHVLFGGIAQPVCDAQVDLWQRMQRFLDRNVREKSVWYQNYLVEKQDTSR